MCCLFCSLQELGKANPAMLEAINANQVWLQCM